MRRRGFIIGVFLLLLVLGSSVLVAGAHVPAGPAPDGAELDFAAAQMASDNFALHWNVAASGGGRVSSASYRLSSTIGQPAIGNFSGSQFSLHAGYWQEWLDRVFLPLLQRSNGG